MLNCFKKSNKLYVTITNTFDCQCCILMCETPHYDIIIYNQKDSPLLVEFVILICY